MEMLLPVCYPRKSYQHHCQLPQEVALQTRFSAQSPKTRVHSLKDCETPTGLPDWFAIRPARAFAIRQSLPFLAAQLSDHINPLRAVLASLWLSWSIILAWPCPIFCFVCPDYAAFNPYRRCCTCAGMFLASTRLQKVRRPAAFTWKGCAPAFWETVCHSIRVWLQSWGGCGL